MMHMLGARYMTLTHTCNTPWADSSVGPSEHDGLTQFGTMVDTCAISVWVLVLEVTR